MSATQNPLTSAIADEVPLPDAPLIRVIAQVRFPQVLSVERRDFIAPLQETIRDEYPVLRAEQAQGVLVGSEGVSQTPPRVIWRFTDVEGNWKISLAPDFAAIETTAYDSREDFFARFEALMHALAEHVSPRVADRIGVRYIDRVTGEAVNNISNLVRSEMLGIITTPVGQNARHTLSDSLFTVHAPSAQLRARWGLLPEGSTVDPAAIEPLNEPSWILDLDMSCSESRSFDPDKVAAEARAYAERIYTFFRWAVTNEFLELYGGEV